MMAKYRDITCTNVKTMRKAFLFGLVIIITILSNSETYAQINKMDKTQEPNSLISKTFRKFLDAIERKDARQIVTYLYPRLFEFVPKTQLVQSIEKERLDTTITTSIQNSKIISISDPTVLSQTSYAIISYSYLLTMKWNDQEGNTPNASSPLDFSYEMLVLKYGEDKVNYDQQARRINIDIITKAIAIQEKEETDWTFLEYKPDQNPVLGEIIPNQILEMAAPDPKPCKDCNSLRDALAAPEIVKSLIISKDLQGVNLESLPPSIGQLKNLKILYLTGHSFTSVPKEIGQLKKLKELSLADCSLTSLPEEIFGLKKLKELLLYDNDFSESYVEELKRKFVEKMPGTIVEFE